MALFPFQRVNTDATLDTAKLEGMMAEKRSMRDQSLAIPSMRALFGTLRDPGRGHRHET